MTALEALLTAFCILGIIHIYICTEVSPEYKNNFTVQVTEIALRECEVSLTGDIYLDTILCHVV